mmetsp:Transcript_36558/g.74568  ORF Transcript_36558/g.74568 Transcript_36558/m.74568 type:complete len:186 (-) Transcript_36558:336-893(-)
MFPAATDELSSSKRLEPRGSGSFLMKRRTAHVFEKEDFLSLFAKEKKKNVRFHNVEIREYSQCIGDNPSCSAGPPVSLDWTYQPRTQTYPLDSYEARQKPSEEEYEINESEEGRIRLLLNLGYTYQELLQADVNRTKDQLYRKRSSGENVTLKDVDKIFEKLRHKYSVKMKSGVRPARATTSAQA